MSSTQITDKKLILVAIKGLMHQPVKEGNRMVVAGEMSKLQADPAWRGWYFQIRTPEGYKAVPILPKDYKKKKVQYIPFSRERKINWQPHND